MKLSNPFPEDLSVKWLPTYSLPPDQICFGSLFFLFTGACNCLGLYEDCVALLFFVVFFLAVPARSQFPADGWTHASPLSCQQVGGCLLFFLPFFLAFDLVTSPETPHTHFRSLLQSMTTPPRTWVFWGEKKSSGRRLLTKPVLGILLL